MRTSLIPSLHIKIAIIYFSLLYQLGVSRSLKQHGLFPLHCGASRSLIQHGLFPLHCGDSLFLPAAVLPKRVKWHGIILHLGEPSSCRRVVISKNGRLTSCVVRERRNKNEKNKTNEKKQKQKQNKKQETLITCTPEVMKCKVNRLKRMKFRLLLNLCTGHRTTFKFPAVSILPFPLKLPC